MTLVSRTGAQILVDQLLVHGANLAFGVPGESYIAVLDAMYGAGDQFRFIVCRHEAAASNMAEATGKLTGAPGLCFVTRGPGATHASTGLHTGRQDSTPMILFVGQVSRGFLGREAFQEIDYGKMFSEVSKLVISIDSADRIPEYMSRAFHAAVNGRPGPVVVVLPEDVLVEQATVADAAPYRRAQAGPSHSDLVEFETRLRRAQRPVLLLGGGGWSQEAKADIARFAHAWGIPTGVSFRRQDLFDNRHDLYIGELGLSPSPSLVAAMNQADLLIALGPRMSEASTSGYKLLSVPSPKQELIHVHLDPQELGRVYAAQLPIVSTPGPFAAAIAALSPLEPADPSWSAGPRQAYLANIEVEDPAHPIDLGLIVKTMSDRLPPDAIICNGAGNYTTWVHRYFQYGPRGAQLAPTSGAMAYGLPAGIAAKLVRPEAPVVVFAGDGCFLMASQELATAVRYGLQVTIIVVNNGSYGTIRMHQERNFPGRVYGTDLSNPDFVALARAYGAHAERVESTEDFWPAYERAAASGGPGLIELQVSLERMTSRVRLSSLRAVPAKA
jgi:acetolactate synthase-1/2/3 large subunit